MASGNVAFVLNAHFPYVRRAGRWPHGEELLHRVIAESYVPLLNMFADLRAATGKAPAITLAVSPVLLEQLADPVIAKHWTLWLGEWRERVRADLGRFEAASDGHGEYLARFWIDWSEAIERAFVERWGRNLAAALRGLLQPDVEVLLTPATYAYLPQLGAAELRAQLGVAALVVLQRLGVRPGGMWLPAGGYQGDSPALAGVASELGLRYAVGEAGPKHAAVARSAVLPVVFPDGALMQHVVAAGVGYPGDGLYREFHREHPESGITYWRVTGGDVALDAKQPYDPYLAFARVEEHAEHFVRALQRHAANAPATVVAFDAELFGHWWFEGVRWLGSVLRRISEHSSLQLVTLRDALAGLPDALEGPSGRPASLHPIFDLPSLEPLRERLQMASRRLQAAVNVAPAAEGVTDDLLRQAARELLLARSGDWMSLIASGTADDYARRRFDEHIGRLERLLYYVEQAEPSPDAVTYVHEIAELDNPFAAINYRLFA